MANLAERLSFNAAGRFYVDASCIDCDLCRNIAPEIFGRNEELGFSLVRRQPALPDEVVLANEALESCPYESIGNDGV